jgi:hypothetical protein
MLASAVPKQTHAVQHALTIDDIACEARLHMRDDIK